MNHQTTQLAAGRIGNGDEIKIALVEPDDGTPPLMRVQWPQRITTVSAAVYPLVAATIVRIVADTAVALANIKAYGR